MISEDSWYTVVRASHDYFSALLRGAAKNRRGQLKQAWVCAIQRRWSHDLAAMDVCKRCRHSKSRCCVLQLERRRMIAEAAYYRAEHRGFRDGSAEHDWLEAERYIDRTYFRFPEYLRTSILFS
jgi:hypothetical protein